MIQRSPGEEIRVGLESIVKTVAVLGTVVALAWGARTCYYHEFTLVEDFKYNPATSYTQEDHK